LLLIERSVAGREASQQRRNSAKLGWAAILLIFKLLSCNECGEGASTYVLIRLYSARWQTPQQTAGKAKALDVTGLIENSGGWKSRTPSSPSSSIINHHHHQTFHTP